MSPTDLSDTLKLAWLVDEHWGKAYPIGDRVTIGRGSENKIILRDARVSRLHAEVRRDGDRFILSSVGTSITSVNGAPISGPHVLKDGDRVEISFSLLRFQTAPPGADLLVVAHDTPIPSDAPEGPTAASIRAARRAVASAPWLRFWRQLLRRLTRGPKTD